MKVDIFNIADERLTNFLTEDGFTNEFPLLKKIYYNIARPLMPSFVRAFLQNRISEKIEPKTDFIWDEVVNIINERDLKIKYPGGSKAAAVLTHDVDTLAGFNRIPKIIELEEKYGFKSSWNIVPYKYPVDTGIIDLIKKSGHEVGVHGYNHDGKLFYSKKIFENRFPHINKAIKQFGAKGFRSPMVHRNLNMLQKLDIEYEASCFDYDPFQPFPGGTGSIWPFRAGKFIELPYTLPQDHDMFYMMKQDDIGIWKRKSDWIIKNKGVILLITHPDYLSGKILNHYKEFLIFLKQYKELWTALPIDLTKFWKKTYD
ncbi:MAG: hypothetical protein R6V47_05830 [Candidatus Delongbacteria bacterium]